MPRLFDKIAIARTEKYYGGKSRVKKWKDLKGELHRLNGPAVIMTDVWGRKKDITYKYYYHGKRHRISGPAIVVYANGKLYHEEYYIDGEQISKEEFHMKYEAYEIAD